ncbi:MAG: Crp/Fnr family transcriptional regulator [Prolixibacteraceae bacterium]|nr:Crp/Fnr family transcriptional regulator [Prolixibacteraceae bacterium]MBN2648325.1 Crp/Fnr family transcriptional regulator [Prolixibacteraceae bacterium]
MSELSQSDIKLVQNLFSQIAPVSLSDIELIGACLKKASYKKDDTIIDLGQTDTRVNLVKTGIVHLYTFIDGEVFTINISLPGMLFNSLDSYIYNRPSTDIQKAITDVETIYLEKSDVDKLLKNNNAFSYIYAKLFEFQLSEREHRTLLLQYKSALKRFELFMNTISNSQRYLQEVPQNLLAQYLGLASETFCRVKAQYLKEQ